MAEDKFCPPALQTLCDLMASGTVSGVSELPDLTDAQIYGPCFNADVIISQGPRLTQDGNFVGVRLKVLSLVATCPTLSHINLSNCYILDESEVRILGLGLEKNECLEFLDLSGNAGVGSKNGCGYLNRILKGCQNLRTLKLARVEMEWEGMARLSGAMTHNIALRHLDVSDNPNLGDNGWALLGAVLKGRSPHYQQSDSEKKFPGLTSVTLSCPTLEGAKHLSKALATQSFQGSLEILKILGGNDTEGESLNSLGEVLAVFIRPGPPAEYDDMAAPALFNESVKILSLKSLRGAELASVLARILSSNSSLTELRLIECAFSPAEWRQIILALQDNTVLRSLHLGSCVGLGQSLEDFLSLTRLNSTIEFIELPDTELDRSGQAAQITDALSKGKPDIPTYDSLLERFQRLRSNEGSTSRNSSGNLSHVSSGSFGRNELGNSAPHNLDVNALPPGLRNLIGELTSHYPMISVLPQLSSLNVEEFGDYFVFPHFNREGQDESWWQTRRAILQIISRCPSLTHIDLEGCGIHKEEEVEDICSGLGNSERLEMLNLGGNGGFGTDVGCLHLSRLLVKIPSLRELHLHAIDMKPDFLVYLRAALNKNPDSRLETLDINFNQSLGDEGAENLATLIADEENSGGIRHLRMFGTGMGIKGAFLTALAIRSNTSLKSIFIGFESEDENKEGPLSMLLSAFIPEPAKSEDGLLTEKSCNTTVENLGICGGRETGLAAALEKVVKASSIRALTLNCSYLTQAGWQGLFSALAHNRYLEALDMTQCEGLQETVYGEIQTMLQLNRKLTTITLAQTELERSGKHLGIQQLLLDRTGSSSSGSETPFLTPTSSGSWPQHGGHSPIPGGTPYEGPVHGDYAPPVTAYPVESTPHWIPSNDATGPPAYFSFGPAGQPSETPGPPSYFSSMPSQGPPRPHSSVNYSNPPPPYAQPPPPNAGLSPPVDAGSGAYQPHGGGYMMSPQPVSSHLGHHFSAHRPSHQPSSQYSHSHRPSHQPSSQYSQQSSTVSQYQGGRPDSHQPPQFNPQLSSQQPPSQPGRPDSQHQVPHHDSQHGSQHPPPQYSTQTSIPNYGSQHGHQHPPPQYSTQTSSPQYGFQHGSQHGTQYPAHQYSGQPLYQSQHSIPQQPPPPYDSQYSGNQIPSPTNQNSNQWSPNGEPVWTSKPDQPYVPGQSAYAATDGFFDGSSQGKKPSRLGSWARETKGALKGKGKTEMVFEVAKQGKVLVRDLAKDKIFSKMGKKK